MKRLLAVTGLIGMLALQAQAQVSPAFFDYVHSDIDWYTIETEHFLVHFHEDENANGSSRTAQVVARIAEDVYGPITELYDHRPDTKVSFILKDYEDYSNGAAYFFDNMIEIWAPALNTPLRGDHNWLRNVITHEFTHMVQVQKTMKANRRLPFIYLQFLDYEDVRRPDVLYGYPNVIATYPVPVLNNPAWLAEGTAQYQRTGLNYDRWDAHRDMILRTRILSGTELSLADMGGFYSHTSLGRETVYNQGFAFTQYLASRFGEASLASISASLAKWPNWNFERATRDAVGIDGQDLYRDWIDTLRTEYAARTEGILAHRLEGETVEPDGFYNLYPRWSPDGSRLAYLSNRGEDFSRQYLHVRNADGSEALAALDLGPLDSGTTCSLGHRLIGPTSGPISWRPDGKAIAYARAQDSRTGHLVSDLWLVDIATKKPKQLTFKQRASDPSYSADGGQIVFVRQLDGTTNLSVLQVESGAVSAVTQFGDGRQVTEPRFDPAGEWIYFAMGSRHGRDIYRVRIDGSDLEAVLATDDDERSPVVDPTGAYVYYASDASGIFNLYRRAIGAAESTRLTEVLGGAFMPDVTTTGEVLFSRYDADGYHIARLPSDHGTVGERDRYQAPGIMGKRKAQMGGPFAVINAYDDTAVSPLSADQVNRLRTVKRIPISSVPGPSADSSTFAVPYSNAYTSFTFLPVIRQDRYISRRRSRTDVRLPDRTFGETALRNTKIGVYTASREVMNGLSVFGGLLVGPASRHESATGSALSPTGLLKLERDMFMQFEYRKGLGLIPARWSPQFSLEVFNIRRNVDNGLSIEEFPCTACFPDTTLADLTYNLWEVDLAARGKVNRFLLLEAGATYSPYKVTTERFFSKELKQGIPESSSKYFIGRAFRVKAYFEAFHGHRHDNMVPRGLRAEVTLEREVGRLLSRFNVEDGFLKPIYEEATVHRATIDARLGMRVIGSTDRAPHGVGIRFRTSAVLGKSVDDFYNDYVGGLTGARGYPFYALGGNRTLWGQVSYSLPIKTDIRRQFAFLYLDKLYARVYADAASAWTDGGIGPLRKDVGAELRLGLGSFYLLPTALFVSGTYGLDAFDFQLDEGFVTPDGRSTVQYGQSVQWHVGLLFGFDQL